MLEERYLRERDVLEALMRAREALWHGQEMLWVARMAVCCGHEASVEPWAATIESALQHAGLYLHQARELYAPIAGETLLRVGRYRADEVFVEVEREIEKAKRHFAYARERGQHVCE